jgi:hypothetical protein
MEMTNPCSLTMAHIIAPKQAVHSLFNKTPVVRPFQVTQSENIYGSVSKPCTPVVHIKIAGFYGCFNNGHRNG